MASYNIYYLYTSLSIPQVFHFHGYLEEELFISNNHDPTYASSKAYRTAASRDQALLVPVGTAWQSVRSARPDLGRELYAGDGSHPSGKGALLAAACFYRILFDDSPARLTYTHGLPAEEAAILRNVGDKAR